MGKFKCNLDNLIMFLVKENDTYMNLSIIDDTNIYHILKHDCDNLQKDILGKFVDLLGTHVVPNYPRNISIDAICLEDKGDWNNLGYPSIFLPFNEGRKVNE